MRIVVGLSLVLVTASCSSSPSSEGAPTDASTNPVDDTAIDSAIDIAAESSADAELETSADTAETCAVTCGGECVDTQTDPLHCGSCSNACPVPADGKATCTAGSCGITCDTGHHACGSTCADNAATATCGSLCAPCAAPANATATCDGTACGYTCTAGFADCDGVATNGCEVDLSRAASCGSCTTACAEPTPVCAPSGSSFACASGCSGSTSTRCAMTCVDTSSDPRFCGGCSVACPVPANGVATCTASVCGFTCAAGYHACGSVCANNSAVTTCGASCTPCPAVANASSTCSGTACGFACNPGYRDCDGLATNGCEVSLATDPRNCGSCGNACVAGATCAASTCVTPRSCLEIHTADPTLASGTYSIDPDGPGGSAAFSVQCDMTTDGGGWTLAASEDFESTTTGWTNNTRTTCGSFGSILGGYNTLAGGMIQKTYSLLAVTHTQARVALDYIKIDSWDGEQASVSIGGSVVWTRSFCFCSSTCTTGCGAPVCGSVAYGDEQRVPATATVAHTAGSLLLGAGSTLDETPTNESWGIDNVAIWIR